MKHVHLSALCLTAFVFCAACSRMPSVSANDVKNGELLPETRYAKSDISVYSDILMETKCASIRKGEALTVVEVLAHPHKMEHLKPLQMAHIVLHNGQNAYREERFFAIDMVVINDEQVPLYTRSDCSSKYSNAMTGSIAMVTNKTGEWLQVEAFNESGLMYKGRWINRGYTSEAELLHSALILDRIRDKTGDGIELEPEDAAMLDELSQNDSSVGILAQKLLSEIRAQEREYEIADEKAVDSAGDETK